MADIELVIKIPESIWVAIQNGEYWGILDDQTYNAIKNGTSLPKGHGRLIDADVLKRNWNGIETPVGYRKVIDFQAIDIATPIIEADKGE